MWTHFWDMHSGGGLKEKWAHIYIEAPESEAKTIFYNRFGHNPSRVSCTCCGDDYSISEGEWLDQLTGYHRGCRSLETPRNPKTNLYEEPMSKAFKRHYYLEKDEKPPKGFKVSARSFSSLNKYQTLAQYLKSKDVLVILAKDIKPEWRRGSVPEQGYVWVGA